MRRNTFSKKNKTIFIVLIATLLFSSSKLFSGIEGTNNTYSIEKPNGSSSISYVDTVTNEAVGSFSLKDIPEYDGKSFYVEVNNNEPFFTEEEKKKVDKTYYEYGNLDKLGRAVGVTANINFDSLPKEDRDDKDELRKITPTGWKQKEYGKEYVETGWLYNRSHLVGYALGGITIKENIVTATRYCNATSMLWFEEECLSFVKSHKDSSILYKVIPIYKDKEQVCRGLLMQGLSVEKKGGKIVYGDNLKFCVYVYNVQPGISISYKNGSSKLIKGYKGEYATKSYYNSKE